MGTMQQKNFLPRGGRMSLYDQFYSNHLDCADHLCNDESSNVDSISSTDESENEIYRTDEGHNEAKEAAPTEYIRRAHSTGPTTGHSDACRHLQEAKAKCNRSPLDILGKHRSMDNDVVSIGVDVDDDDDDDDDSICSDPFFSYSNDKKTGKKGGMGWANSKLNPLKRYTKALRTGGSVRELSQEGEGDMDEHLGIWTDFTTSSTNMMGGERCMTGSVEGRKSVNLALQKRGFYTVFIKNAKAVETKKQELCSFKIKFKYMILDCKREKFKIKGNMASTSSSTDGEHDNTFIVHDPFVADSLSFRDSGTITLGNRSVKILLLRAGDDAVLQFSIAHHILDVNPVVLYKLAYSGWCQPIPLNISPRHKLRILSIDSCENLGTTALAALYALEQRISALNGSNAKLADYFDVICGTGTGAILALCLHKGYSIKELRVQWQILLSGLFKWSHSVAYGLVFDHAHVNKFMRHWIEILGIDFMCSKARPLCMLTSANVKGSANELFVFRNYNNFHSPYPGTALAPMWFAGWASNAMPTYMKGPSDTYLREIGCNIDREAHFVDGQLLCSNPSMVALQETCELYGFSMSTLIEHNIEVFLSLGTTKKPKNKSKTRDLPAWQVLMKNKAPFSTHMVQTQTQQLFAGGPPDRYQRIEIPQLHGCKYGKTGKSTVDETFNQALDLVRTYMSPQLEKIAKVVNF